MRVTKDPEERRQELLEASLELFLEKGYDKTAVKDIVKKVGVTQGLLYYYFPSKEDILKELAEYYKDKYVSFLTRPGYDNCTSAMGAIRQMLDSSLVFFKEYKELIEKMHKPGNGKLHDLISYSLVGGVVNVIEEIIILGNETGEFDCAYPKEMAPALAYGVISTVHNSEKLMIENLYLNKDFVKYFIGRVLAVKDKDLEKLFQQP